MCNLTNYSSSKWIISFIIIILLAFHLFSTSFNLDNIYELSESYTQTNQTTNNKTNLIFTIQQGIWVILPFNTCIVSSNKFISPHMLTYYKKYIPRMFYHKNKTNKTHINLSINITKSHINHTTKIYCNYNKNNSFPEWLYNNFSKFNQIYIKDINNYYYLYNSHEINQCFIHYSKILFLGDSTMQNIIYDISSFILDKSNIDLELNSNSNSSTNIQFWSENIHSKRHQKIYYNNDNNSYTIFYRFPQMKLNENARGLSIIEISNEYLVFLKEYIISNNITIIIFNSLLHDALRQSWMHNETPLDFYYLFKRFIVWLFNDVFNDKDCKVIRLYVWSGINPAFIGKFHDLQMSYFLYLETMINALNDLISEYHYISKFIQFIDTAHVSDGHFDKIYSDGIHYGFTRDHKYVTSMSRIVNQMATQIIINDLCNNVVNV